MGTSHPFAYDSAGCSVIHEWQGVHRSTPFAVDHSPPCERFSR